jgi:hypothetical protein
VAVTPILFLIPKYVFGIFVGYNQCQSRSLIPFPFPNFPANSILNRLKPMVQKKPKFRHGDSQKIDGVVPGGSTPAPSPRGPQRKVERPRQRLGGKPSKRSQYRKPFQKNKGGGFDWGLGVFCLILGCVIAGIAVIAWLSWWP